MDIYVIIMVCLTKEKGEAMTIDKDLPVSIFIPDLNEYVEVVGAICQVIDGKQYLRIVCKASSGKEHLLNAGDLEIWFKRYAVPF
jgi:hypothetical protein